MTVRPVSVDIVTGFIRKLYPRKGYGFAATTELVETCFTDVFFWIKHVRRVEYVGGSPEIDVYGGSPYVRPYAHGRDPMWIVMSGVSETPKGWRAELWGPRPGPNWMHDSIERKLFGGFVGGMLDLVTLNPSDPSVRKQGKRCLGRIHDIKAEPELLTIVAGPKERETQFAVTGSRQRFSRDGDMIITFRSGDDGMAIQLTLSAPPSYYIPESDGWDGYPACSDY